MIKKVDNILIGGAMVLVLLKKQNKYHGKILFNYNKKDIKSIINNPKLVLPEDFACTKIKDSQKSKIKTLKNIEKDDYAYDIGPKTIKNFKKILNNSKTIIWNGPLGYYEKPKYAKSTKKIIKHITKLNAYALIGGGDTEQVLNKTKSKNKINHVCVGGGSMLKYLSNSQLPGLKYLIKK
jgi:phosphoglycerate kinase